MHMLLAPELTLRGVLADIPHDAAAVVVYLLVLSLVLFTWYGSRKSAQATEGPSSAEPRVGDAAGDRSRSIDRFTAEARR